MSRDKTIKLLRANKKEIQEIIEALSNWLNRHSSDEPEWLHNVKQRNHYRVKLNTLTYKINQLEAYKPILGEGSFLEPMNPKNVQILSR